jgi:hypothetical protein
MMFIQRFLSLLTVMAMLPFLCFAATKSTESSDPNFAPGQEWSIKSTSPTTAKVVIGRVEKWGGRVAVHVSIVDIPVPSGLPGAGGMTQIEHIPFDKVALLASTDRLLAVHVSLSPNFEIGYKQWQEAKGGIFTISVPSAISLMFQSVNRVRG